MSNCSRTGFEPLQPQLIASEADSRLDHLSALDIDSKPNFTRLTGIICTIGIWSLINKSDINFNYNSGPSSRDVRMLVDMIKAGMNIVRMNFSHGTYDYHGGTIANVREAVKIASQEMDIPNLPIAIALDTKGPEIRTGLLKGVIKSDFQIFMFKC